MEDVILELQEHAQDVLVPLELPSDDDLLEIEETLLLPIPREYREFLVCASDLVLGTLEPCTAADRYSHTYLPEVTAQCWDQGLPRHLMPICVDGSTVYAIDPDGTIECWKNGQASEDSWESIWEWALQIWLRSAQ